MAEAIPYGVAANILTKLGSSAFKELGRMFGVEEELRNLKDTLSTVNAVLLDAEEAQEKSQAVKVWIKKLREVVYDADDVLDEFATKDLEQRLKSSQLGVTETVRNFLSSSNPIAFHLEMGTKIEKIMERLDKIAADMSKFSLRERTIEMRVPNREREQTLSYIRVSDVIGRDKDKEKIIELLMQSSTQENVSIISIVGIGGLGKTTLAQFVYNDEKVVNFFKNRIWVCVSENFDVKILIEKILRSIFDNPVDNLDMDQLQSRLRQRLRENRYLLVLDDVWNQQFGRWNRLNNLLKVGAHGSKILVTTRSTKVASIMGVESPYILKGLTEEESWGFFKQLAFGKGKEKTNPNLVTIGKEIIKRCKGVPLAIRTLGSLLQFENEERRWLAIQNSEIWKLPNQDEDDIFPALRLSYYNMPIHLRPCFAYCSIFPKDYEIDKQKLIWLWMAQGYVQPTHEDDDLEDIGNNYFMELLSMSFFEEACVVYSIENQKYKMHDLIHDLAQSVAGSSCAIVGKGKNGFEGAHHVSFAYELPSCQELRSHGLDAKSIRTIFFPGYWQTRDELVMSAIISEFKHLRALDLHISDFQKLPCSIGELKQLRYLDLSDTNMKELPDFVSDLCNLETLILSYYRSLKELPRGLRNLINLKFLMIDGCDGLIDMPTGLGELKCLLRLSSFVVGSNRKSATLNELNGLNHLRGKIRLKGLENVRNAALDSKDANLKDKKYLPSLILQWGCDRKSINSENSETLLDNLQPHPNLKELLVVGYPGTRFSSWLSSITNLVKLELKGFQSCRSLPPLDQLPYLETLEICGLYALEYISGSGSKVQLSSSASTPFFPSLKTLRLRICPNLKDFAVGRITSSTTKLLPQFPCLSQLSIEYCHNLTLMPLFPTLESELLLKSSSVKPLQETMRMVSSSASSSSSPIPFPLSKLTSLNLYSIEDLESFPAEDGFRGLTSLRTPTINGSNKLNSLSGVFQHFTALQKLEIEYCKELDFSSNDMQWEGLRSLSSLSISGLPQLVSFPNGLQHVTTLQSLSIGSCESLAALPQWIGNLTSLQFLSIEGCPELKSLPEEMCGLTSLQELRIYKCPHLTERCQKHMGEDWSKISHIPTVLVPRERPWLI